MFEISVKEKANPLIKPWKIIEKKINFSGYWTVSGDITGNGIKEFVTARNDNQAITTISAYDLDSNLLWKWGIENTGKARLGYDVPLQIYDITNNGNNEVIFSTFNHLIILEGKNGEELERFELPKDLEVADCIAFGKFGDRNKPDIIIKSRYRKIWAYTADWELLWSWKPRWKKTCHYPLLIDIDGDGYHEVFAGNVMLDHDGRKLWKIKPNKLTKRGHHDCARLVRYGKEVEKPIDFQFIITYCGAKWIGLINGNGDVLWKHEGNHFESIDVGNINSRNTNTPHFYVDLDHLPKGQAESWILDYKGNIIGKIYTNYDRQHRIVDWTGDGYKEIVLGYSKALIDGMGKVLGYFDFDKMNEEIETDQKNGEPGPFVSINDISGNGTGDILLYNAKYVFIYKNPNISTDKTIFRDASNFTLY